MIPKPNGWSSPLWETLPALPYTILSLLSLAGPSIYGEFSYYDIMSFRFTTRMISPGEEFVFDSGVFFSWLNLQSEDIRLSRKFIHFLRHLPWGSPPASPRAFFFQRNKQARFLTSGGVLWYWQSMKINTYIQKTIFPDHGRQKTAPVYSPRRTWVCLSGRMPTTTEKETRMPIPVTLNAPDIA